MRPQPDLPPRPSGRDRRSGRGGRSRFAGRGRALLLGFLGLLFVLLISMRGIAAFYTDYLWFDSLELSGLWRQVLVTKASLTILGGVVFFLICWGNLLIAERLAPVFRPSSGDDDLIDRYNEIIGQRAWMVRAAVALFLALAIGVTLGAAWNDWILFTNRVDFGVRDETFNTDIGFYVFQLPFLTSALAWLFSSLIVIFIVTVLAHVVNGGIRFQNQLDRVTPQVKAHLSVLLGVLALVQAGRYWLDRYSLTFSTRGTVDGATYTDVNVTLRAVYLLMLIALFAFGLFIANIWRRGWVLPGMAVSLWVLVAVLAGGIVPAFVQRVRVEPTESTRERPYIANNIAATRSAYGLSEVEDLDYDWTQPLDASDLEEYSGTMDNVRLWDPAILRANFSRQQELRPFYEIGDVDVDRYEIDGEPTQLMLAARDLNPEGIQRPSWEATHLIYTNGYGVVAAAPNAKLANGDPSLLAQDIPLDLDPSLPPIEEERIYFGENKSGYVIVNTDVREPADAEENGVGTVEDYDGADGIRIGSGPGGFLRKAAFSLRFGDLDPMVSGSILPQSRVIIERDVTSRLDSIAPFLAFDHDPYLVLTEGRLQYVVDGYTTTRNYPNAQRADTGGLDEGSGLYGRSFNYVRNSVKAVIDAYDGTVTLYVVDDEDPIIRAYQKAFPDLFTDGDEVPEDLRDHFRYPEDLFTVQTQMWARYHVGDPDAFYEGSEDWVVPQEVGSTRRAGGDTTAVGPDGQAIDVTDRYASQYLLMQLPGEDEPSFVLLRPFVTASDDEEEVGQNQLRAFMTASSDPGSYGELRTYRMPESNPPDGPNLAAEEIRGQVGEEFRDLCTERTVCTFASPSIVPVADSLLYVQSLLVAGSEAGRPRIEYVIVNYRTPDVSRVEIARSLRGALVEIFGEDVPESIEDVQRADTNSPIEPEEGDDEPSTEDPGTIPEQEGTLIDQLVAAFDAADVAGREGDLVEQARQLERAAELAADLQALRSEAGGEGDEGDGDTTTTTEPSGTTTTTSPQSTTTTTAGA
jgi:uncharacterized membrane protein (UPF0182 family)